MRFPRILCCITLLTTICSCAKQPTQDNYAEDQHDIHKIESTASEAFAAKDLERLVSLYADNAALYYESDPTIIGKAAIRETWKKYSPTPASLFAQNLRE